MERLQSESVDLKRDRKYYKSRIKISGLIFLVVCCTLLVYGNTGSYQGWQELIPYTKFAEFTLTKEDAQKYLYADSTKHRVHRWNDIKVSLYI